MKKQILELARKTIQAQLFQEEIPLKSEFITENPIFGKSRATFVTLKINGTLRGCIGSLVAHRDLYDDLVSNSINAAFKDPRFMPLSKKEFESLDIEVSLLSESKPISYENIDDLKSKVAVGVDGIILKLDSHQATFLPQVWEELKDFESFFGHLLHKAGLPMNSLEQHPLISKYQVEKIK